jgi:hypothetical protein
MIALNPKPWRWEWCLWSKSSLSPSPILSPAHLINQIHVLSNQKLDPAYVNFTGRFLTGFNLWYSPDAEGGVNALSMRRFISCKDYPRWSNSCGRSSAHRKHATSLMVSAIGSPHLCSRRLVTKANTTQRIMKICVAMIPNHPTFCMRCLLNFTCEISRGGSSGALADIVTSWELSYCVNRFLAVIFSSWSSSLQCKMWHCRFNDNWGKGNLTTPEYSLAPRYEWLQLWRSGFIHVVEHRNRDFTCNQGSVPRFL